MNKAVKTLYVLLVVSMSVVCNTSSIASLSVAQDELDSHFVLVDGKVLVDIYVDEEVDPLILWAAEELQNDIKEITGQTIRIHKISADTEHAFQPHALYLAQSTDSLLHKIELPDSIKLSEIVGKWEHFSIVKHKHALYVVGSDVRATVYAIFDIAERLGISPWQWWADVHSKPQSTLVLALPKEGLRQSPSVQYRGIFLNDEDWGLQPWAAKTFETALGDIGPKSYEKIFQLLLRLKANTIWPAMHPSTQAFYSVAGNQAMAQKYHIVVGTSHAEPMLRNNVGEWDKARLGDYNYVSNSDTINEYWQARVEQVKAPNNQNIFTIGMRGVHDSKMQGINSNEQAIALLERIIATQRNMLTSTLKRDITQIPQAFIPYKEVLNLYNVGLSVPDDVTLIWPDDNYGYIRRLSNEQEQLRKGGSGVYYHISYWGRPHDYLWLSTHAPALIWYEMSKAYANGATKVWIVNVGDIKPAEYNMTLFLDLAWDVKSVNTDVSAHLQKWMSQTFNPKVATELTAIMNEYYRLAFLRKPEFMGWSQTEPTTQTRLSEFSDEHALARIEAYQYLSERVDKLSDKISKRRKDAFFQLVEYPVKSARAMNEKYLYRQLAINCGSSHCRTKFQNLALLAHQSIHDLSEYYNVSMSDGKWRHMMSSKPRNLPVFQAPSFDFTPSKTSALASSEDIYYLKASDFTASFAPNNYAFAPIQGLGHSDSAVTLFPLKQARFDPQLAWLEYQINLPEEGDYTLEIRSLPTHANDFDHQIQLFHNQHDLGRASLNTVGRSEEFKLNVLRNSQITRFRVKVGKKGQQRFRVGVNQTGIVLDQIAIYPSHLESPYLLAPMRRLSAD